MKAQKLKLNIKDNNVLFGIKVYKKENLYLVYYMLLQKSEKKD